LTQSLVVLIFSYMMRHQGKKVKHKREFRYPGICEAAKELGVNRSHLYRVLSGERVSPRIEASKFYRMAMAARQEFEKQQKGHDR